MKTPRYAAPDAPRDLDETLVPSSALPAPLGHPGAPVVEFFDTGVPGRIVAHMPSGPLDGPVDFVSYLDLDAPLGPDGAPLPLHIVIVPSFSEGL